MLYSAPLQGLAGCDDTAGRIIHKTYKYDGVLPVSHPIPGLRVTGQGVKHRN